MVDAKTAEQIADIEASAWAAHHMRDKQIRFAAQDVYDAETALVSAPTAAWRTSAEQRLTRAVERLNRLKERPHF